MEEQLFGLVNHLRFDAMAKNEAVNGESLKRVGVVNEEGHFIRKGSYNCKFNNQSVRCTKYLSYLVKVKLVIGKTTLMLQ